MTPLAETPTSPGVVFRRSLFVDDIDPSRGWPLYATLCALASCGVPIDVFKALATMDPLHHQTPADVCASVTVDTGIRVTARRANRLLNAAGLMPKVKAAGLTPWYSQIVQTFPRSVAVLRIHAPCPAQITSTNGGVNLTPGSERDPLRYFAVVGVVPDRGVRVLNTEGPAWGDKGRAWLSFRDLAKATAARDAEVWVMTREDA